MAFVLVARCEICRVWSAESDRNAKTLTAADGYVGVEFPRRFQECQRENVGGDDHERTGRVRLPDQFGVIVNRAVSRGILHERAKNRIVEFEARIIINLDVDPERFRAGLDDLDRLRMTAVRDEKCFAIRCNRMTE